MALETGHDTATKTPLYRLFVVSRTAVSQAMAEVVAKRLRLLPSLTPV